MDFALLHGVGGQDDLPLEVHQEQFLVQSRRLD